MIAPMRPLAGALVVLAVSAALGGCAAPAGPEATTGATTYTVDVVAGPDGAPLAGATVVFFTHVADGSHGDADEAGEAENGYSSDVDRAYLNEGEVPDPPVDLAADDQFRVLARAATGPDGRATAAIGDTEALVSVAVGGVDGFTVEVHLTALGSNWTDAVRVDPTDSSFDEGEPQTVPLYPDRLPIDIDGVLETTAGSSGEAPPFWVPTDLELPRRQRARMVHLEATLTWNNTATASADLYLGAGAGEDPTYTGSDQVNPPADGPQTETLTIASPDGEDIRAIGPVTNTTENARDGVPYGVRGELQFQGVDVVLDAPDT